MFKSLKIAILLLLLVGCKLNSKQEKQLNIALSNYTTSRNNGAVTSYVSILYPPLVREYKNKGWQAFKEKFSLENDTMSVSKVENPLLKEFKQNGNLIQIRYEFNEMGEDASKKVSAYAISEDDGNNWFFLEETDYKNSNTCKNLKRLIH